MDTVAAGEARINERDVNPEDVDGAILGLAQELCDDNDGDTVADRDPTPQNVLLDDDCDDIDRRLELGLRFFDWRERQRAGREDLPNHEGDVWDGRPDYGALIVDWNEGTFIVDERGPHCEPSPLDRADRRKLEDMGFHLLGKEAACIRSGGPEAFAQALGIAVNRTEARVSMLFAGPVARVDVGAHTAVAPDDVLMLLLVWQHLALAECIEDRRAERAEYLARALVADRYDVAHGLAEGRDLDELVELFPHASRSALRARVVDVLDLYRELSVQIAAHARERFDLPASGPLDVDRVAAELDLRIDVVQGLGDAAIGEWEGGWRLFARRGEHLENDLQWGVGTIVLETLFGATFSHPVRARVGCAFLDGAISGSPSRSVPARENQG